MSSSNRVRLTAIKEAQYGVTPSEGNFSTLRFTSESLSGSPDTVESETIRADRMSSGQVVVGLSNLGGEINFEMATEPILESFMSSAMMKEWVTPVPVSLAMTVAGSTSKISRTEGDFSATIKKGDMLLLSGFVNAENNTKVMVTEVEALELTVTSKNDLVDENIPSWETSTEYDVGDYVYESGNIYICKTEHTSDDFSADLAALRWELVSEGQKYKIADYLDIGTDQISFTLEKAFLDLTTKGIVYPGSLVNTMNLNINYGAIVTGSFGFNSNGYTVAEAAEDFATNGRTINDSATTTSLNGSVDMPFIASDAAGDFEKASFCIQEVGIALSNNMTPENCIGRIAPNRYNEGSASIEVNLSSYLSNNNWDILKNKLSQTPFALGFAVENAGGLYGFFFPAIQVSMDDPSAGGRNQDVMLNMTGLAKVGASGESALRIFRA